MGRVAFSLVAVFPGVMVAKCTVKVDMVVGLRVLLPRSTFRALSQYFLCVL